MKPCVKCGEADRYADGTCKNCKKINGAAWIAANKERKKANVAAWAKANIERKKETNATWQKNNPERLKELTSRWSENNKDRRKATQAKWASEHMDARRIHNQNRRARKAGGKLSIDLAERLFRQQKGLCPCCGMSLGNDYELDHIDPLSRGGEHSDRNIQLLRSACNRKKGTKDNIKFMQEKGFLI